MKPGGHSRRAYDADGKIFEPPAVADQLAAGYKTVTAWCEGRGCVHRGDISLEGLLLTCRFPMSPSRLSCAARPVEGGR